MGLASHGFVPSLLSHGYESKNLGLDVYTRLHMYTGCLVRPLKSVAGFLEFKIDTITGFSQYSFHDVRKCYYVQKRAGIILQLEKWEINC